MLDPALDPYPDGLLARLAALGENAVWLHVELSHLAALPWAPDPQVGQRRAALGALVKRAAAHGMKIFLYLNEPRSLPAAAPVFQRHPDWRGVPEGAFHAVCTSAPAVRAALREAIAGLCRELPDLGGFFTITASENLTNCWSHGQGGHCPNCKDRPPAQVIAEVSAVPYLPVLENITRHATALRDAGVGDIMLGWTLGGHPSPNLQAIGEINAGGTLDTLALKRHGAGPAGAMARFWRDCSTAFREFPYHIGCVYHAPLQMGPANPLWPAATGYRACMVGIPYDDLKSWRAIYPAEVFARQLDKVARDAKDHPALSRLCTEEAGHAIRLHALQGEDPRIGFEASNQYYYIPLDLVEKVINCRWLARRLDASEPAR